MMMQIERFMEVWNTQYAHLTYDFTEEEVQDYLKRADGNPEMAADYAADYLLSQGLGEVEE